MTLQPRRISIRKQAAAAEIERQRNAKVVHQNEPNPVLMQFAMDEIMAANLRRLELELSQQSTSTPIQ